MKFLEISQKNFKKYLSIKFLNKNSYIRKLKFESEPNYKMITFEFKKAAETLKLNLDGFYDWSEIR